MAHSSDTKANTVHSRAKRSCLNCERYFTPKNSLPKYVEGGATQTWCSKDCYTILHPQVVEEVLCRYCPMMFIPRNKRQVTCGSEECKKKCKGERNREYQRERLKDPEVRKEAEEYNRKRREDPEHKERSRENNRRWMENPENRRKVREYHRKRREDPEVKEKGREYDRKRREDPEYREYQREYQKAYHLKNKQQQKNPEPA